MEQTQNTQPVHQGKGMAIAGFVIAIVALVFYLVISPIVVFQAALGGGYGLGIFWLILAVLGTALSIIGVMKLGKTGGKKGLGIAGGIIGGLALILSLMLVVSIGKIQNEAQKMGNEFIETMKKAESNNAE